MKLILKKKHVKRRKCTETDETCPFKDENVVIKEEMIKGGEK